MSGGTDLRLQKTTKRYKLLHGFTREFRARRFVTVDVDPAYTQDYKTLQIRASAANEPTRYRAARSSAGIGGVAPGWEQT